MPRKGKKKKQQQDEKGASTSSGTTSNEPLQSPSISQQPQQQQQQRLQETPQLQLQGIWAKRQQQQMQTYSLQQQPQGTLPKLQQQQRQTPQQQQRTWTQVTQQQHQIPMSPPQQQQYIPMSSSQQQMQQILISPPQQQMQQILMSPPQQQSQHQRQISMSTSQQQWQQIPTYPSQQQPQGVYLQQHQIPMSPLQQQQYIPMSSPQQQMQQISTYSSQQQSQEIYIRPQQQQIPMNLSQQQQHIPMSPPQQQMQQMLMSPPQYQWQILMSTSQQQWQQIPTHPLQQQSQGVYIQPQQQQIPMNPSQQQQQEALDQSRQQQQQQQMPTNSQQQLQGKRTRPPQQQQQRISVVDTSDSQQTQAVQQDNFDNFEPQSSASAELLKVSVLSLRDPLQSIKISTNQKLEPFQRTQYELCIPTRKSFMKGRAPKRDIKVKTNMFEICFGKDFISNAVHYDVTITPKASKLMYKKVFEECRKSYFGQRYPAYDGKKNAYSANDLPFDEPLKKNITIENKTFEIALTKVKDNINLSWIRDLQCNKEKNEEKGEQVAIQVLDIIFRHAAERIHFSFGSSIYFEDAEYLKDNNINLGKGLCLRKGGYLSAIAGWKAYLNMDVAHKGFFSPKNVAEIINEFRKFHSRGRDCKEERDLTNEEKKEVDNFLKNLKVSYEIPNQKNLKRIYRINQIGPSADEHKFEYNGNLITITQYFANHKQYKLIHPHLPCLWVGAKERVDKIYLPAELCHVMPNQPYVKKLDNQQTANMIKNTTKGTDDRQRQIKMAFEKMNVNESLTLKKEFKLSVNSEPKEVDARVLNPPKLEYSKKIIADVKKGTWTIYPFKQAEPLQSWAIFSLVNGIAVDQLTTKLTERASFLGMSIARPKTQVLNKKSSDLEYYFNKHKKDGVKLVIVIIPNDSDTYCMVKQISELSVGILTQCIKHDTVKKILDPSRNSTTTLNNLFLKINSKLNGINHIFSDMPIILQNDDCMLVGADVSHPSPDSESNLCSIAAVVASQDTAAFQYNVELRSQEAKTETIADLESIIVSQISNYRKKTNRLPKKIIYYRDGVSEGQFGIIIHYEINAIKNACRKFHADKVKITCLVVQKRHHVRLFPSNPQESDDKCKNVRAGTIVDTEITHPNQFDFYLVSHPSIQGTARPSRYRCIYNDSEDYSDEDLEELTYYLCHMYARCARAVSYPAPTYYAHLAAYRGRNLMQGNKHWNFGQKLETKLTESPMFFI